MKTPTQYPVCTYRDLQWTTDRTADGWLARVQLPNGKEVKAKRAKPAFAAAQLWAYNFIDRYLDGETTL